MIAEHATRTEVLSLIQAKIDALEYQRRFLFTAIFYGVVAIGGFAAFFEARIVALLDLHPVQSLHAMAQAVLLSLAISLGFLSYQMIQFRWNENVRMTSDDEARLPIQGVWIFLLLVLATVVFGEWVRESGELALLGPPKELYMVGIAGMLLLSGRFLIAKDYLSARWISRCMKIVRGFSRPWRKIVGRGLYGVHVCISFIRHVIFGLPSLLLIPIATLIFSLAMLLPDSEKVTLGVGWQLGTLRLGIIVILLGVFFSIPLLRTGKQPHRTSLENLQRAVASGITSPSRAMSVYGNLLKSGGRYGTRKQFPPTKGLHEPEASEPGRPKTDQ
jgi:hypothetical protein